MGNKNAINIGVTKQATESKQERAGSSDLLMEGKIKSIVPFGTANPLSSATGVQSVFGAAQDVITLEANTTYKVRGKYFLTTGTTTTKTTSIAFLATGLTIQTNGFTLFVRGYNAVANTTVTATNGTVVTQLASTVVTATATTAGVVIEFEGMLRTNAGGTITPQVAFSAAPGGTCQVNPNSFIEFIPEGTASFVSYGPVN